MCEIGMFRSPDGRSIVGLARSQSHEHLSSLIVSHDEGQAWQAPIDLPGSPAGERHKVVADPVSGRLVVPMGEILYDLDGDGVHSGAEDWKAGDWIAWVGTYEQLVGQHLGRCHIRLAKDYSLNRYAGDTGYTGVVVDASGELLIHSFGHFDEEYSRKHFAGDIRTDHAYVLQARFTLAQVDAL